MLLNRTTATHEQRQDVSDVRRHNDGRRRDNTATAVVMVTNVYGDRRPPAAGGVGGGLSVNPVIRLILLDFVRVARSSEPLYGRTDGRTDGKRHPKTDKGFLTRLYCIYFTPEDDCALLGLYCVCFVRVLSCFCVVHL